MNNNRQKNQEIVIFFILLLVSIGLCVLLSTYKNGNEISTQQSLSFLLVPLVAGFSGMLLQSILERFLAGKLAVTLGNAFSKLGWGMAAFLFFFLMPGTSAVNLASFGIPFLFVIYIIRSEILVYFKHYIIVCTIVKAVLYILQGIIICLMIMALVPGGMIDLGIQLSAAYMALFGCLTFAAATLLSLLELSDNERIASAGKWFGKTTPLKFIFGCSIIFVFKDLRSVGERLPQYFVYIEWFSFFVILMIISIVLFNKIRQEAIIDPNENLRKHLQEVVYNKESEALELTRYIDDYITKGDFNNLLISIINIAKASSISNDAIGKIIDPLIYFKDIPLPLICTQKERMLIQKRVMEDRQKAIEYMIIEIKRYGRKNNEY